MSAISLFDVAAVQASVSLEPANIEGENLSHLLCLLLFLLCLFLLCLLLLPCLPHAVSREAARLLYLEEIFNWTDAYSETSAGCGGEAGAERLGNLRAIGQLWAHYVEMEQRLKQWKKAVQIFEDAMLDPVASSCLELHLAYVSFCRARGKINNAQKVFVRSLTATCHLHDPPPRALPVRLDSTGDVCELSSSDLLWIKFLLMMKESSTADLRLEQLFNMLSSQMDGAVLVKPVSFEALEEVAGKCIEGDYFDKLVEALVLGRSEEVSETRETPLSSPLEQPGDSAARDSKGGQTSSASVVTATVTVTPASVAPSSLKRKIVPSSVSLLDLDDLSSSDLTGSGEAVLRKLLQTYGSRPSLLFSAPHKEPRLSGFRHLDHGMIGDLMKYFDIAPSDVGDRSGSALEQTLVGMMNSAKDGPVGRLLDVLEGLWTCQGLKESHFDTWFTTLLGANNQQEEVMRRQHYEEESLLRSSKGSALSLDIMRSRHDSALRALRIYSRLKVDVLNANINRTLCLLREEQEKVLQQIKFPYSDEIDSNLLYHYTCGKGQQEVQANEDISVSKKFDRMQSSLTKQCHVIGALQSLRSTSSAASSSRGVVPLQSPGSTPTTSTARNNTFTVMQPIGGGGVSSTSPHSVGKNETLIESQGECYSPDDTSLSSSEARNGSGKKKKKRRKLVEMPEQYGTLSRQSSGSSYSSSGGHDSYNPFGGVMEASGTTDPPPSFDDKNTSFSTSPAQSGPISLEATSMVHIAPGLFQSATSAGNTAHRTDGSASNTLDPGQVVPAATSDVKTNNLAKIAALLASKKTSLK